MIVNHIRKLLVNRFDFLCDNLDKPKVDWQLFVIGQISEKHLLTAMEKYKCLDC